MMGMISRAVACQYRGGGYCNKKTKDSSELCHHHRRNNFQHSSSENSAPKLRLHEATRKIQSGDAAAMRGKVVLDNMPTVHRNDDQVGIRKGAASSEVDTIIWNDTQFTLQNDQPGLYNAPGLSYPVVKDGTWLYGIFPKDSGESQRSLMAAHAYNTRNNTARRLFQAQGMFDGLAERYDDKAEILVQLPLNDDPNIHISYTSVDDNEVKVRINSTNSEGYDQVETYTASIKQYTIVNTDTLAPNNEVDMPGTLTVNGKTYPVPEALSNSRAQFFHNLTEALNVIDTYSAHGQDGALYIPVGWMER